MSKPKEIVVLEKYYNIVISEYSNSSLNNKNYFLLDENSNIVSLSLIHNKISNISFLKNFPFLKSLNLSYNQILDISGIENLQGLESINLSGNQISDIYCLGRLTNLKTLILNGNSIYDASSLANLISLNNLNLSENQISEIEFLCELTELIDLNLNYNIIYNLSFLDNLMRLKSLHLNNNHISNIVALEDLKELNFLDLSNNEITDISHLEGLKELTSLHLSKNEISNMSSFQNLLKLKYLFLQGNRISDISHLENLIDLEHLQLDNNNIEDISPLKNLQKISNLDLSNNKISEILALENLINLKDLSLSRNVNISDITILKGLKEIIFLDLSNNKNVSDFSIIKNLKKINRLFLSNVIISDYSFLEKLNIRTLFLGSNNIVEISFLKKIKSITTLYLNYNKISNIDVIKDLIEISSLYLSGNNVKDISVLKELTSLKILELESNQISEIEQFEFIYNLPSLNIKASYNPCFKINEILLEEKSNHYDTILNALKKINESKKMYRLPAKVLFLGNTESGKSTLLDYILQTKVPRVIGNSFLSTHIVQIETLPKKLRKNAIPEAVFYDFGGQDYYHGLYKAFLSNDSINILLWNKDYDKNQIRRDRNKQLTRDYNRDYWLNQLKFQYDKGKNILSLSESEKAEPILLVQTHADIENHSREAYKGDCENFNIKNEFFISLNQDSINESVTQMISLNYLEETLKELINQKQIEKREPIWFKEFLNYILRTSTQNYILLSELANEYKRDSDKDNLLLPEVLRELAQTGLVLYYKDDIDLKDIVWLDPSKTIQYIHDSILSKSNIIEKKGIVERSVLDGFADQKIVKLLLNQKVIFFDEFDDQYIIPGYLCLTEEDDRIYELLTFDFIEPNFIMKFEYFIPFGLINQLICHYGKNKHKKYYWRDQLLFTKGNSKILIKLDFTNLEILVSIKSKDSNSKMEKIQQEIFTDILDLYWDKNNKFKNNDFIESKIYKFETFNEKNIEKKIDLDIKTEKLNERNLSTNIYYEFIKDSLESPEDLYISIDNKYFVNHKDLEDKEKTFNKIMSFGLEISKEIQNNKEIEIRRIDKTKFSEKASGLYRSFTTNINAENMKRIFISYAKENKKEVNEFQKQIAPFKLTKEVETWHCSELQLGEDWDSKIKNKFYEADIILYFISTDFFSTPFILDEEVKRGIERDNDPTDNVVLIPIILEKIHWEDLLGKYSSNFKGKAINSYDKSNNAWYEIVDDLKKHHFRKIDPNSTSGVLGQSKEKMKAQEDTIAGEL
ncbi:leucine-rich repeat domain-containing protein [Flavobacterium pectinovorum]|uniref:TIR domain-containing protein n=1 Tax=Flavobacterium pectinovorum TaxID=29533 RepID=A0A502E5L0_9FLAO|nr:leucine-rich repeat domain-containing protein [Flavobacterium pectinovorum]TPG32933.1 TIR domain-containing protein [Flavobacterium pectinovorum]